MGESWPRALVSLTGKNRRRYGGYIVHLAMVLLVIGVVGSSAYTTQHSATLAPGQSLDVQDYTLTFTRLTESEGPNYTATGAELTVAKGSEVLGTLSPERRSYPAEGQNTNEPAIRSSLLTGEDLFVILDGVSAQGEAAVKVLVNPLVNLIWLSGVRVRRRRPDRGVARPPGDEAPAEALRRGAGRRRGVSDLLALVLVGVAAAAAIVLVATPLLRAGSREERLDAIGEGQRHRLALREERDDALAALRELEFDHRTGKITDEDYRPLVGQYRRRVAAVLEALDAAASAAASDGAERGVADGAAPGPTEPEAAPNASADDPPR